MQDNRGCQGIQVATVTTQKVKLQGSIFHMYLKSQDMKIGQCQVILTI